MTQVLLSWPLLPFAGGVATGAALCLALVTLVLRLRQRTDHYAPVFVANPYSVDAEYVNPIQLSIPDVPTERHGPAMDMPVQTYRLVFFDGHQRRSFRLSDRQCLIGRDPGCDLRINRRAVSALHARLSIVAGRLELTDIGSTNGTFIGVSGRRLAAHQPEPLEVGDEFSLGSDIQISVRSGELG